MTPTHEITIFLVEDDDIDAEAVKRAFRKQRIANPVVRARDGVQALAMLRDNDPAPAVPRPFIILLDLKMPRMDGIEFLRELRDDPALRRSIVFVLTTSDDDRDKWAAYDKNIAGYLVKARVGKDFINLVNMLGHYWRYIEFPPELQPIETSA